jgi:flagellin-like hook-associated protein FlgL
MNIVAHNLTAMNASRQLNITTRANQKNVEKLSSGYRINRAADDAAGLSISEKMRAQIRGLNRASDNIEDGISYVQVADGALEEVNGILQRINELAVQSANGTNSASDREAINDEVNQLKLEMEKIFTTTTFNDKKIWPDESIGGKPVWVGTVPIQAVKITTPRTQKFDITNANYDKIAKGSYKIHADNSGVSVSWTDYDGDSHQTKAVDWATLEANNYSFQIGDYFDPADTELFENDNPVFDFKFSMSVVEEADVKDIIASINGTSMSSSTYSSVTARFEDAAGNEVKPTNVSVSMGSINNQAAYESRENVATNGYDFDNTADDFFSANTNTTNGINGNLISIPANGTSDINTARDSTDKWVFSFNMKGIGDITATSSRIRYYSNDYDSEVDLWWEWYEKYDGTMGKRYKPRDLNEYGNGTLGSLMAGLTGDKENDKISPGLLNENEGGAAVQEGYITFYFEVKANGWSDSNGSSNIGEMSLTIKVTNKDTEQTVLDNINNALNSNTIVDVYTTSYNVDDTSTVYNSSTKSSTVDHDVYDIAPEYNDVNVNIHAGASKTDKINMRYKCLRLASLELMGTNVLTEESATKAIDEVSKAITIVSKQRSQFGAYQNRLEHAKEIDDNSAENTAAAESRIRDADMADLMVEHSIHNILMQAGQNMLAQANQSNQGVLSLLI